MKDERRETVLRHGVHGGNIWAAARKYNRNPESFIDFSANQPAGATFYGHQGFAGGY
jgi:hypothetical protein